MTDEPLPGPARALMWGQGAYFLATGIWPLISITTFMMLTGPKTDLWLVKTVGVVVAAIGAGLLAAAIRGRMTLELWLIAVLSAAGLAAIDIYYAAKGTIRPVYLLDAALEILIIALWFMLRPRLKRAGAW